MILSERSRRLLVEPMRGSASEEPMHAREVMIRNAGRVEGLHVPLDGAHRHPESLRQLPGTDEVPVQKVDDNGQESVDLHLGSPGPRPRLAPGGRLGAP
jgi:hypothetical protein